MKNVLLEEQLGRIKRLLKEKKTENTQTILSEQPIVPTLLKRFLGAKVVSKMETSFGDDVIKNLESLFAKSSANIIKDATGEVFVLSRAGYKIPMKTISTGLDNVASGKMTADDLLKLLPSKLKDGTDFKVIVQNELKNVKPKTSGTSPKPKPTSGAGSKQPVTFGGGKGLASLPLKASVDDVMKYIDVDPIYSGMLKTKKGSRELLIKWIETNIGDKVTPEAILGKVDIYFDRLSKTADVKTNTSLKILKNVFNLVKKGEQAWQGSKGFTKWGLAIGLIGVTIGLWTLKDFMSQIVCRLGWEKTNDWFGCRGNSGSNNEKETITW